VCAPAFFGPAAARVDGRPRRRACSRAPRAASCLGLRPHLLGQRHLPLEIVALGGGTTLGFRPLRKQMPQLIVTRGSVGRGAAAAHVEGEARAQQLRLGGVDQVCCGLQRCIQFRLIRGRVQPARSRHAEAAGMKPGSWQDAYLHNASVPRVCLRLAAGSAPHSQQIDLQLPAVCRRLRLYGSAACAGRSLPVRFTTHGRQKHF
jgi:hypothetical protein